MSSFLKSEQKRKGFVNEISLKFKMCSLVV